MKANIKHLILSISVAVVLLCVFAGVSGIASVKTIPVPNDYDYSMLQPMIDNAPIYNDFYGDALSDIVIVNDTSAAHLAKTASWYRKHADDTEHLYGESVKRFKKLGDDKIYALDVVPRAQFTLEKNFGVGTEDDFIMSGTQECKKRYWLDIYNYDDASDTVLGNLSFSAKAENITGVDWKRYADWNESFVKWEFPPYPRFTIEEDEGFGTWIKTISEEKYINVDVSRGMNETEFNADGYQLVEFNVTFKDVDFLWCWGRIEANEHEEVRASIVPGSFDTDAPGSWDKWDHGIHFDFDREQIETNVTYNFSVVVRVEPKKAPPIEYKPMFKIGQGLNDSREPGGEGCCVEMPLPVPPVTPLTSTSENIYNASACTNVSNNWDLRQVDHRIVKLKEVVDLAGPHAEFEFSRDFNVWTRNDTLASGTYERNKWYWMHIENMKDTSGAALSNLSFSAKADNITDVAWEGYAKWNESYVEWNFPAYPRFIIDEEEGFGTGFGRGSETRDVNVSVSRWMNETEFNSSAYQLAKFNVTFDDTNFEWVWARIEANERHEIEASIVPGTFTYDAPLGDFDEWDHGIHFNFNKSAIQTGVTYNFSVIVKVKPPGKEAPPILYKPQFSIGKGLYYNTTTGVGQEIEIPSEILPENVYNASVSTNVSNAWVIKRHNHIIVGLEEVSELAGPHARFCLGKGLSVWTQKDSIASDTCEPARYWLDIYNKDDTSDTVLGNISFSIRADNITGVDWKEYAEWNETSAKWTFPSEYVLYEKWDRGRVGLGTAFSTNYTEKVNVSVNRWMNETGFYADGYQLAEFNVTFKDTDFLRSWGEIWACAFGKYGVKATIVPETFYTDAPLGWFDEWEHGIYFNFDKEQIGLDKTYNFSVIFKIELTDVAPPIVCKPHFYIGKVLSESHGLGGEGYCVEIPEEMLPEHVYDASVCTNVSNNWTLGQGSHAYTILEGVSEPVMNSTICGYVTEEGWIKNSANGHYYKLTAPMNWLDAEAQAIEWDGHLVTLNSWEEESWIKTVFGENEYFWIGFNDIAEEGNWVWSNGESSTYINWAEGEPNNCGGSPGECWPEDAAVMNWEPTPGGEEPRYGDYWNDGSISDSSRGIVESVVEKPTSPIPDVEVRLQSISYDNFWCIEDDNGQLIEQWNYTFQPAINRMQFGASPAIADIGVNNNGSEPDSDLEIVTGSDECGVYSPELGTEVAGLWHAFDSVGNVEWVKDTESDQARSSAAIVDVDGDGYLEIVGGTTSGETVEVMDRFGNFTWTFPDPPRHGNLMYHSSPAVADVNVSVNGLEVIIGNRPLHTVFCLDGNNSDGVDEGVSSSSIDWSGIGEGTEPWEGVEGKDWDILWIYTTEGEIISTPAIGDIDGDGSLEVVIGSTDGYVYCLNGTTGALEWSYHTDGGVDGSAGLADFDNDGDLEIVIGSTDGKLYFINGDEDSNGVIDDSEVGSYQTGGAIYSSPAIGDVDGDGDFEVIVGSNDNKIYSFDYYDPVANTATKNWEFATDGAIYSSSALADRTNVNPYDKEWPMFRNNPNRTGFYGVSPSTGLDIYVGSNDGYLYLLHGNNGSLIDRFLTSGAIRTSPSVADVDNDTKLEIFFYDYDSITGYELDGSTDEDGYYKISTFGGHFRIDAHKGGYLKYHDEKYVPENETVWVNITLDPTIPHAEFSIHKNFNMHTQDDSIINATYDADLGYHLQIDNEDDGSDTVLGNLTFSIQTEKNITGVDWRKYADWNESYAEWQFPPGFTIEESEGFGFGISTSYSEPKYFNLNISRWFNQTEFNETAYQLVNFTVELEDTNFEWLWGSVGAREHKEVYRASIVPGTFETNAPLERVEEDKHEIHFDFNETELQSGVTYNFSVVVKVEPRRPVIYKPDITIGQGLYHNSTAGERGYTSEMPAYMLPENVSYASVSTSVSNTWKLTRVNHLIAGLGEVVELAGPHAQFSLNKDLEVRTEDDAITSGAYELNIGYWMDIYNENDTNDTFLGNLGFTAQANNITDVDCMEEYAEWNESYVEWNFPAYPEFIIDEDEGFGTGFDTSYSEIRDVNVDLSRWMNITVFNSDAYQLAEFTITFRDGDFMWCWGDIEVNEHHEVRASIVPDTFSTDAPLDWIDVEEDGVHFNFDKGQMQKDIPYNFAVVIKVELTGNEAPPIRYKPEFYIGQGIYYNESTLVGKRDTAEMPEGMLPDNVHYASVTTNVSNYWTLKRHNQIITVLEEVVELAGPHAEFHFNRDFNVWTRNDTIACGTHEGNKRYWMHIENKEDTSGTALSDFVFSAKADTITDVDWGEYAEWNESSGYVEWNFPTYPKFTREENEGFGTGFSRGTEIKDVNMNVSRWMNITEFNSSGYQLAEFNVTFDDTNFEWVWAHIEANNHHEVKASIVPCTFTHNAPFDNFDVWDHGIQFNFDKELIQPGDTYNFSVVIKVELTGKEAPPILYKPKFVIGEGLYYNSTTGDGYEIEIPAEMLPDNVSYASVSTDVSNAWLIKRHNHTIAELEEVSELIGPHAVFSAAKVFHVVTENDTIHSGTYERNLGCELNIKNSDDTSDTALGDLGFSAQADNITTVSWEEYAEWNETSVEWTFPSEDFVIDEDDWFGHGFRTNHTEVRHLNVDISRQMNQTRFNDSAYQSTNFTVTFEDTDFQWCGGRIEANEHYKVNASIVPDSFETDAPLDWIDEAEHEVHFGFEKDAIEPGVAYNFSAIIKVNLTGNVAPPIVYKPLFFIYVDLDKSFAPGGVGFTAEMPPEMLPSYVNNASVTTNVSNNWTLRQVNRTIVRLKEVYGSTRIEAWIFDVYMNTLPTMPNATFSSGMHENLRGLFNRIENPTSTSIFSPSMLLETLKPVWHYETADVEKCSYDFISDNSSKFNWSLYDIPSHEGAGRMVVWGEMKSKDYGYEASVSVDKFEFSSPSEQNLNITVDVYDNSSMEGLHIEAHPFDEDAVKNRDFISVEFTGWSSDITPVHFTADYAFWAIQNPEAKRYTFSVNVSVTPHLSCAYKPSVGVVKFDFVDEYLVNSSSEITQNTWAGNYTISMDEARDWVVYRGNASISSFPMIAAENSTTISGYVKDDDGNPIKNTIVSVNRWNESEYQDYVETSTDEFGYYEAYVKSNETYKISAGWSRQDYSTEEVENITITSLPHTENFTLHNASVVCGGVFDKNKNPMEGMVVMMVNESSIIISSDFTNEDGYYRQLKVPEYGNYTVKVEGYDSNELHLSDVGKGKAILHNFVVEPLIKINSFTAEVSGYTLNSTVNVTYTGESKATFVVVVSGVNENTGVPIYAVGTITFVSSETEDVLALGSVPIADKFKGEYKLFAGVYSYREYPYGKRDWMGPVVVTV